MTNAENPRAVIGGNAPADAPDYAALAIQRMAADYAEVANTVSSLLAEARDIPKVIEDDETKGRVVQLIKRFRDLTRRLETFHAKEKEPSLRTGQGVDQWFFGLIDKCARRSKANNPGAADVLLMRLDAYDQRLLAQEQARRAREAAEAERVRREAEAEALRLAQEAEAARLAAERARAPAKVEEKTAVATQAESQADAALVDHKVAASVAEDARIASLAKPADIMRMRDPASGTLSTMGVVKYADIVDASLLDMAKLWPFISLDAKAKALRAWANNTGYLETMPGANVGKGSRSKVV